MEFKWSDLERHGKFKFCLVNYLLQMTKQGHCTIETVDTIVCVLDCLAQKYPSTRICFEKIRKRQLYLESWKT